jgi:phage shock protein C
MMTTRNRHRQPHYDRSFKGSNKRFQSRRRAGWGMNIYRNTHEGKVAGVAAGLADYWDIAPWVVRLVWVGTFLFTGTLAIWLYLGAWLVMAPRPSRRNADGSEEQEYTNVEVDMEYDERHHDYRPRKVFRYSDSSSVRLQRARERLDTALRRVESVESYVTSRQYELNKEFSKL